MVFSNVRRGDHGGASLRTQAESLSPPPPRSTRDTDRSTSSMDSEVPHSRWPHRQLPAPVDRQVSAGEAVASALNMSPSLRGRMTEESLAELSITEDSLAIPDYSAEVEADELSSVEPASEAQWAGHGFADLEPIAESPSEAVPERTPELTLRKRFDTPAAVPKFTGGVENLRTCDRFTTPSTGALNAQVEQPHSPPGCSSASCSSTRLPSSRSRRASVPQAILSQPTIGSPVCFYVDGCVQKYVGWLKAVSSNGLHVVDLVGGGRMAGLEAVSPCTEDELKLAEKQKLGFKVSEDAYSMYSTRNKKDAGGIGLISSIHDPNASVSSGRSFSVGDPVSFVLERHELAHVHSVSYPGRFFGRVQKLCDDGSYVVELAGGVRKSIRQLEPGSERELEKASNSKKGFLTRKDSYSLDTAHTRNTGIWGGGCRGISGYRETSPRLRSTSLKRSMSLSGLPKEDRPSSRRPGNRSMSPPSLRRDLGSGHSSQRDFKEGDPVTFRMEGRIDAYFGRIRTVEATGTFIVDCAGGRRAKGVQEVSACSEADLEQAVKSKKTTITRIDAWAELSSRNRPSELSADRSPSPTPCLRGVPINSVPRSATRMSLR